MGNFTSRCFILIVISFIMLCQSVAISFESKAYDRDSVQINAKYISFYKYHFGPLVPNEIETAINNLENFGYEKLINNPEWFMPTLRASESFLQNSIQIDIDTFRRFSQKEKIVFWINFYNIFAINALLKYNLTYIHPSLFKEYPTEIEKISSFFKDPFFSTISVRVPSIGELTLQDISWGIMIGDDDYLNSIKDTSKRKTLNEFHSSFDFQNGKLDPRYLFFLSCGSPICPNLENIPIRMKGAYLEDEQLVNRVVKDFLDDSDNGLDLNQSFLKYSTDGDIISGYYRKMSIKYPYFLSYFEKPLVEKYKSIQSFLRSYYLNKDFSHVESCEVFVNTDSLNPR